MYAFLDSLSTGKKVNVGRFYFKTLLPSSRETLKNGQAMAPAASTQ